MSGAVVWLDGGELSEYGGYGRVWRTRRSAGASRGGGIGPVCLRRIVVVVHCAWLGIIRTIGREI